MSRRVKVLYIAGAGRSGTTFLGQILGQVPGFCFAGEIIGAWRTFGERRCGCGASPVDCPFWNAVRHAAGGASGLAEARDVFAFSRLARWRHMPWLLGDASRAASRFGAAWSVGARLYEAISAVSEAQVIVDSSKSAVYGRMLNLLPEIDLHVVHVVRDARAVAHSWRRSKSIPDSPDQRLMSRRRAARSAMYWAISNAGAELFCVPASSRYLRMRYEDWIVRPRHSIQRILDMLGEEAAEVPALGEARVTLLPTHSVKGNPDRFRTGSIEFRLDDEWRGAMRARDRFVVTALTWPLLVRYGYARSAATSGPFAMF